eukprot:3162672-Pleurochrysis_carterae.AAC.2
MIPDSIAATEQTKAPEGSKEARGKVVRDMHKAPEGGDRCEGEVARGMPSIGKAQSEEDLDEEMDIERQEGRREMEKFVHGKMGKW